MAPTLRRIIGLEALRLRWLAGSDALDRPVRWVAVSELEDPTPFLEGAELVLTTGMRDPDARPYVARLVARGVAGLGFGVGLTHEKVPGALVSAARDAGLPLLEVPRGTPFIAIGKAVSELLAAEQYEELRHAFSAQGRLTRAALHPDGPDAVIERLAREVDGWALLLDESGAIRHAAGGERDPRHNERAGGERDPRFHERADERDPRHNERVGGERGPRHSQGAGGERDPRHSQGAGGERDPRHSQGAGGERDPRQNEGVGWPEWAVARAVELRPELDRLRATQSAAPATLALSGPGEHVIVQPLGRRGFFAVGGARRFSPVAHTIVNAAGSLLTLALEQGAGHRAAERAVRGAALRLVLAGQEATAAAVLAEIGVRLPVGPVLTLAVDIADFDADLDALPCFTAPYQDVVIALAPVATAEPLIARAAERGRVGVAAATTMLGVPDEDAADTRSAHERSAHERPADERPADAGAHGGRAVDARSSDGRTHGVKAATPRPNGGVAVNGEPAGARAGRRSEASLDVAVDQAVRALGSGAQVARFDELAGQGLLSLLDPEAARAYAATMLAPLLTYGSRADLVESLRAYLSANGHWDAAAQRLGVHRHTLRYRMKRVTELLGRDLDDPATRAELWIALSFWAPGST